MQNALWKEILPNDLLERPRSSRIFYNNKLFSYPLKPLEALFKMGFIEATLCVISYLRYSIVPIKNPKGGANCAIFLNSGLIRGIFGNVV